MSFHQVLPFALVLTLAFSGLYAVEQTPRYNIDADLNFMHDFGVRSAGSVLNLDVGRSPGVTYLTGRVDNGSSTGWAGGGSDLIHYTCVIPSSFAGVHNGRFSGNYGRNGGSGGTPPTWNGGAKAVAFKIIHTTVFRAPDGTASDRLMVGVSERVELRTEPELNVTWSCTQGGIAPAAGTSTVWKAPFAVGSPSATISAEYEGQRQTVEFAIMSPTGITGEKITSLNFASGFVAVGMRIRVIFNPMRVSFGGINAYEEFCVPTNKTGFFATHLPMNHIIDADGDGQQDPDPSPHWVGENNALIEDTAFYALDRVYVPPFPGPDGGGGSFTWRIPTQIQDIDTTAARLNSYNNQDFILFSDGEFHVVKYGVTERRRYVP